MRYYEKGMKRLKDEEEKLKKEFNIRPNCINTEMDVQMFGCDKNTFIRILINLEDEDRKIDENPFEDLDDSFIIDYTEDFIKYYEKIGRYDIVR